MFIFKTYLHTWYIKETRSDLLREIHGLPTAVVTTESSKLVGQLQALYLLRETREKSWHQPKEKRTKLILIHSWDSLSTCPAICRGGGAHCPLHVMPGRTTHWPSRKQDPKRLLRSQSHCRVTLKVWFLKMVSCLGRWQMTKRNVENWNFGDVTPCCWGSSSRRFGRSQCLDKGALQVEGTTNFRNVGNRSLNDTA